MEFTFLQIVHSDAPVPAAYLLAIKAITVVPMQFVKTEVTAHNVTAKQATKGTVLTVRYIFLHQTVKIYSTKVLQRVVSTK